MEPEPQRMAAAEEVEEVAVAAADPYERRRPCRLRQSR
jgi:hypothetical protein